MAGKKKWMKEADMAAEKAKDQPKSARPNPKAMRAKMYGSKE